MSEETSVKDPSRREFLKKASKLTGAGAAMIFTGSACAPQQSRTEPGSPQISRAPETPTTKRYFEMVEGGRGSRTQEDIDMLNETMPGIDLTYGGNTSIDKIRQIPDKKQRFMEMIGFLDVEHSHRYSWPVPEGSNRDPYYCNVYAIDFARGLIGKEDGKDDVGYRVNRNNGAPISIGPGEWTWESQAEMDRLNAGYRALSSNEIDAWMKDHGSVKYNWERVTDKATLYQKLSEGAIAIGATKDELVQDAIRRGEEFTGHAFVLGAADNYFFLTQATSNIALEVIPRGSINKKVNLENSDYHFWAHKLP